VLAWLSALDDVQRIEVGAGSRDEPRVIRALGRLGGALIQITAFAKELPVGTPESVEISVAELESLAGGALAGQVSA
jgi:hypothetical protein